MKPVKATHALPVFLECIAATPYVTCWCMVWVDSVSGAANPSITVVEGNRFCTRIIKNLFVRQYEVEGWARFNPQHKCFHPKTLNRGGTTMNFKIIVSIVVCMVDFSSLLSTIIRVYFRATLEHPAQLAVSQTLARLHADCYNHGEGSRRLMRLTRQSTRYRVIMPCSLCSRQFCSTSAASVTHLPSRSFISPPPLSVTHLPLNRSHASRMPLSKLYGCTFRGSRISRTSGPPQSSWHQVRLRENRTLAPPRGEPTPNKSHINLW